MQSSRRAGNTRGIVSLRGGKAVDCDVFLAATIGRSAAAGMTLELQATQGDRMVIGSLALL